MGECLATNGWAHVPAPFMDATSAKRPALDWFDVVVPVDEKQAAAQGFGRPDVQAPEVRPTKVWSGSAPPPDAQMACEATTSVGELIPAVDPEPPSHLSAEQELQPRSRS